MAGNGMAKEMGLAKSAGKEDPVELDSGPPLWKDIGGVEQVGAAMQQWKTTTLIVFLLIRLSGGKLHSSFF